MKNLYNFLSLLVPVVITTYCLTTIPGDFQKLTAKPVTTAKIKQEVDSLEKEILRADVVIEARQLSQLAKQYNELYNISVKCLEGEKLLLNYKPVTIHEKAESPEQKKYFLDTIKFQIYTRPYINKFNN